MSTTSTLVSIGRRPESASIREKLYQAPIADKFFLCGVCFGLYGMSYLGLHLWLMLTGHMRVWDSFHSQRLFHAAIQLYLFFGAFILGFALQAAPKLLMAHGSVSRWAVFLLIPLVGGIMAGHLFPASPIGNVLVAGSFLAALALFLPMLRRTNLHVMCGIGALLVISLASFAGGAFLDMGDKPQALLLYWAAVGPALLAASQQFLSGILGGRKLSLRAGVILSATITCSILALCVHVFSAAPMSWHVFSLIALFSILFFLAQSRIFYLFYAPHYTPLHMGFLFAWSWAICGAVYAQFGAQSVDKVLHIWATGWGTTLILAISPRIIGFLSGKDVLGARTLTHLLVLWQVVPIGRGLLPGSNLVYASSLAATIVLVWWGICMLRGIFRLLRHQAHLKRGRAMVQC